MSSKSRARATSSPRQPAARSSSTTAVERTAPPFQRLVSSARASSPEALLQLQNAAGNRAVQRLASDADKQPPRTDPNLFNVAGATLPPPGGGDAIPDDVRSGMEGAFGHDFSDVRVHVDSSPDSVGALAYTQGSDIHFRPGEYQPGSPSGREAIGHELAHVVQQREGRVDAPQGQGAPVNADPALEQEADDLGRRAARS